MAVLTPLVSFAMSAIDIILRERDDYRRQAAKLRQDVVSLHARLAALENDFDELKSENTNIKMRLARATEGRDTSQVRKVVIS